MVLPLNLAMNASEMSLYGATLPCAWMACHFSAYGSGITNLPPSLPPGSMLILNDRFPCQGHSPRLVAAQLKEAMETLDCESLLLDFQRPPTPESTALVDGLLDFLPRPVAVSRDYAPGRSCAVFLPPCPLHLPLPEYLEPWQGRELWLEAALCQEVAAVTREGTQFIPCFPTDGLEGGFYDETLRCCYIANQTENSIQFTLFDTAESLARKLELAHSLGVKRAVGLYQELGSFSFAPS